MNAHLDNTSNNVEVELLGGIGNQLFAYATGFSVALRSKLNLCLNISQLRDRGYQLDGLGIDVDNISQSQPMFKSKRKLSTSFIISEKYSGQKRLIVENERVVDDRIFEINSPTFLRGYFQSWKYFDEHRAELLDTFRLDKQLSDDARFFEEELEDKNWTAVHLRRGDYLDFPEIYKIPSLSYYASALRLVSSGLTLGKIVVFTDDKRAATKFFPNADFIISPQEIPSPAENILLMRKASSIIGANSTFSWWAAYLSDQDTGLKIFPRPWFLNDLKKESEILLPDWITLGS